VVILQLKAPLAIGMTLITSVIPVNIHRNTLHAVGVYYPPGPASENFDEVPLTDGNNNGNSPRTFGSWTFSLIDNAGANDPGGYVDVTNHATGSKARTHLANDGNDKALSMLGSLHIATAAVIKPSSGEPFSLTSFDIENGSSSPDYRVVGYYEGTPVVSQDFTAQLFSQTGPYTVTLTGAKWNNIDEFRIVRQDGAADIGFYMDDIEVGTANPTPTPTTVTSIKRASSNPTNGGDANQVEYTMTFAAPINHFNAGNFSVTTTGGVKGAVVFAVGGTSTSYTVTVSAGTGDGTLTLNLLNSNGLSGPISNTPFAGETFEIDKTAPAVSIGAPSVTTTSTGPVSYIVTYTDAHAITSTLTPADITLDKTGTAAGTVSVSGSGTKYTVTISGITGAGTLGISVKAGTAKDAAGNTAAASNASSTFNVTKPVAPVIGNLNDDVDHYTEGEDPIYLDAGTDATVTGGVAPDFNGGKLTVSITGNLKPSEDFVGVIGGTQFKFPGGGLILFEDNTIGTLYVDENHALVISFTTSYATVAAVQALIRSIYYYDSNWDAPSTATRTISVALTDGNGQTSDAAVVTVLFTGVNDPPSLSATGHAATFTEGGPPAALFSDAAISTVESGQKIRELDLSVSGIKDGADEILNIDGSKVVLANGKTGTTTNGLAYMVTVSGGDAGVQLTSTSGVSTSIMTGVVNGLSYANTSNDPTVATRTITLTSIQDNGGNANGGEDLENLSIPTTVAVVAGNKAPVLTTSGGTTVFTEGNNTPSVPVVIDGGITVSDPDNTTLTSGIVYVTGNFQNDQDVLIFANDGATMGDIIGTYNKATGVMTLSSASGASIGAWESALRSITYGNKSENPNSSDRTINFSVSDGSASSASVTKTVSVKNVNDAPIITSNGGGSTAVVNVPENKTTVTTVIATDADAKLMGQTITYTLSGGADQGLFSIDDATGVLAFKTAPDFENPSDADGDDNYEVTVRASDGLNHMDQALTITVTDVNDNSPVIHSNGGGSTASINVAENNTQVTTVKATDKDPATTLTYSLNGGVDKNQFTINATTGVLIFKTAPDFENPTDDGKDNAYEITVGVSDGTHIVDQTITVTVTDVNDNTPVITSDGGGSTASVNMTENNTAVTTVKATDADAGTTLIYTIVGGVDQGLFSIDGSTGKLTFKAAPDFENPSDADGDGNYHVTVRVSDGLYHMDQALTVSVIDSDDNPPVITSNGGGSTASVSILENTIVVTTVTATDKDAGTTFTYSLEGGADQDLFSMNGSTGILVFKNPPDFENPADDGKDNAYEITVGVSDGAHTVDQAITVTVTDVNDNTPVIISDGGGATASINVAENTTAVTTVKATDADAGTTLVYMLRGGVDQGRFSLDAATGVLTFKAAPDYEKPSDADGNNIFEVTVRASDGIHTTDQAIAVTVTNGNDIIPVITPSQGFTLDENSPHDQMVGTVAISDADGPTTYSDWAITAGNTGGGFAINAHTGVITVNDSKALDFETTPVFKLKITASDGVHTAEPVEVTVSLNDMNDAPTDISLDNSGIYENNPSDTPIGRFTSSDQDAGSSFSYALVPGDGDADNTAFTIDGDKLKAAQTFDYEKKASYSVRVRTTDNGGLSFDKLFKINIKDVNEAPAMDVIGDETVCSTTEPLKIPIKGLSAGPEKGQTYTLSIVADQDYFTALSIEPGKDGKATIHYSLTPEAGGVSHLKVMVKDNGGNLHGGVDSLVRDFTLTVNKLPTITISSDNGDKLSKGILSHLTAIGAQSYQWASGPGIQSGWNEATLAIRPQQDATYSVTGTSAEGCSTKKDFTVQVITDYKLICNNIVSPNGDGKNDTWIIQNIDSYINNEVKIFDRSGRMIYHKKSYDNQWNGTLNGGPLNKGTYYYIFIVDGGKKVFKGFIELL